MNIQNRKFNIYRRRYLKFDIISAIVVFLVAIPLCLGIALASNTPLFSGIISGIIGGLIVGTISGSQVSVSGPAAGMVAVVLAALAQLNDFNTFLLALFLAGFIQIIIGSVKAGFIAEYIPTNVIQGLLCAIGILLIIKQLPLAFSYTSDLATLNKMLIESTTGVSFQPLLDLTYHINLGALIISISSLGILKFFDDTKLPSLKFIPGAIIVVIFAVILNEIFLRFDTPLAQNTPQLVNIPPHDGFIDFIKNLEHPNFSQILNYQVYLYAFILAMVASLESLLNVKACERLDTRKRHPSKNRELIAQGIGNSLAGLLGGIPITSVIVRSSVNIEAGARTKFSTILHGLFILISVLLMPQALNKIPISCLAAILIYTGYKLTNPRIYRKIYNQGLNRFIPFITTVIFIVVFNLLLGIILGILVSLFFILKSHSQARIDIIQEIYPTGNVNRLILPQNISFLNKASLIAELDSLANNTQLIIDARFCDYIDKEIIEYIHEFKDEVAPLREISINLIGFKHHYHIKNNINFINVTTYDVQVSLTPARVLNILKEGNGRFLNDRRIHRSVKSDVKHTALTQHPIAVVLGCIDSRVPVETVFDMSFGDLFCIRIAGNVINNDILASMEYACAVIGAKLIVVLGHTRCGAIAAACDEVKMGHVTELLKKIQVSIDKEMQITDNRTSQNQDFVSAVTDLNIANTICQIYEKSTILKNQIDEREIGVIGAIYDVKSGAVKFNDFNAEILTINKPYANELSMYSKDIIKLAKADKIEK